jgi:putative PIN family toxin of toxin-antitoxin system
VSTILRVVIDTNVVFEGLTKQGSAASVVLDAWLMGELEVYVSNALAYEYADVLSRKLSETRWQSLKPVLGALLAQVHHTTIHYSWRPISPDPADEHVIDCAMNAGAIVVTSNVRDFQTAKASLGLPVMAPLEVAIMLAN